MSAQVSFSERQRDVEDGGRAYYRYETLSVGPNGTLPADGGMIVGDEVILPPHGVFRVVDRQWHFPEYGSRNWPHGKTYPAVPILEIVLERSIGIFVGEAADALP